MKSFRELEVWKKAMDLTDQVYRLLSDFPNEERFALGDQLRRAVVSIPSNIAEGFGRETHKDFAHYLSMARGSLYEVDTQIEIARRLGYLSDATAVVETMNEVAKMLSSLSKHLHATPSPKSKVPSAECAPSTPHQAPRTPHQALSTKHQALGTKHQALSTKH